MRKPPVCIRCSNPVGRVPARVNLGQLNSSRVIMAHQFQVFCKWVEAYHNTWTSVSRLAVGEKTCLITETAVRSKYS